jgi:hypothetical protein
MNLSADFKNLVENKHVDTSGFSEQTMETNLTPTSMMKYVELPGLRGR